MPVVELPEPSIEGALIPTMVYDIKTETGRTLDVYVVNGRHQSNSRKTMIVSLPWSEYVARPDAQDRYKMLAEEYGALVIAVDNPGIAGNTSKLTLPQRIGLAHGCFTVMSELQWKAIEATSGYRPDDDITLWGYSLGGLQTFSMAATAPEGTEIKRFVVGEALTREQSLGQTVLDFAHSNARWKQYLEENPDWVDPSNRLRLAGQVIGRPRAHGLYAKAMGGGVLLDYLSQARKRETINPDTEFHLYRGEQSRVSSATGLYSVAERLHELGVNEVEAYDYRGEDHAMINSLPRMAAVARHLGGE